MNTEEQAEVRYSKFQSLNPEYKDLDWADLTEPLRQLFRDEVDKDGKMTTELNDDNLSELADNAARKAGHEKCLLFEGCNDGSMECGDCPYNFDGEY
jgi:hypothetical protein